MVFRSDETETRLGEFLQRQQDEIVAIWTRRVRELSPAREMTSLAIMDHVPEILDRLATAVNTDQRVSLSDAPRAHAVDRLARGFDLGEVVREYTALRYSVLDLWEKDVGETISVSEVRRLHRAIDDAVEEATVRFTGARERVLKALDRIAEAALGSDDLDLFLRRLLQGALESSESVDSAVVLLRAGEWLRVRGAVGLARDIDRSELTKLGEGFAGKIATTLKPQLVREAGGGIRAQYGVPLVHAGECVGVAYVGSATAYEFSEEDKLLFRTMASRATGVIVQTELMRDLAQREADFRTLADNIAQLAWMADETGQIFWYNKRWFEYTGTTLDEMQGSGWQRLHHPEHRQRVIDKFRAALASGEPWEDTFPMLGKDGNYRWFLTHAVPIKDASGRVLRWFGTNTDITEQREHELRLQAAEARLRLATEATQLGTWDLNLQTGESQWSPGMRAIFGISFEPHVGWTLDRIHPEDRGTVEAMVARSYDPRGDGGFTCEYRVRVDDDDKLRWVISRGRTFFDERGKPVRMVGTTLDITARKRGENAARFLSDATALLASSLDYPKTLEEVARLAVPQVADLAALTLVGREGRLTDITVVHQEPWKADLAKRILREHPTDRDTGAGVPHVIRTGKPLLVREITDEILQRVAPDEEVRSCIRGLGFKSYLIVPMVARERVLGALTLASADVRFDRTDLETAQHLARRAALAVDNARLYEEAREAMRLRERVLAIVSHDLRDPLNAIQLASNLISSNLPESSGRGIHRQVGMIGRAAARMERLIGDLLDVAAIQAGRLSIDPRSIAVGPVLSEAVTSHETAAGRKGVKLRSECATPELTLRADPDRLLQILANLIGNAIKFCRRGEDIMVRAERQGREMLFSVRDSGPGMTPEEVGRVFQPYWSAAQHAHKGTGLGLYICRGIVEAHGGRIWAESRIDFGSTFFFTIPIGES